MKEESPFLYTRQVILEEIAESFGSPLLTIELIPKSSWCHNLWSQLDSRDWGRLKVTTSEAAQHRCEVCGGVGSKYPVDCHERWEFEEWSCTQSLVGLIALCPACHSVKHLGRSMNHGLGDDAKAHLRAINKWSTKKTEDYVALAFNLWEVRSLEKWYVDLSWLKQFRITPKKWANSV